MENIHTENLTCKNCGCALNEYNTVRLPNDVHVCYKCAQKMFENEDYDTTNYMHRTQDVVPVMMTPEMIDFIKQKIKDDIDPYDDTENNPLAQIMYENMEHAESLSQAIFGQLTEPVLWVSLYESNQFYGGPEEGGWYYWAHNLLETHPCTSLDQAAETLLGLTNGIKDDLSLETQETMNSFGVNAFLPTPDTLFKTFCKPNMSETIMPGYATQRNTSVTFQTADRAFNYKVVVELQPGNLQTVHAPHYE